MLSVLTRRMLSEAYGHLVCWPQLAVVPKRGAQDSIRRVARLSDTSRTLVARQLKQRAMNQPVSACLGGMQMVLGLNKAFDNARKENCFSLRMLERRNQLLRC